MTSLTKVLTAGLAAVLGAAVALAACTSKQEPVGASGECFLATDCAPGLVCIEQPDKTRACSGDLSRVAGRPRETGGQDGEAPPPEAGTPDGAQPPRDSSVPDTNVPDTASPADAAAD